jgi:hypothetical protein
MVGNATTQSPSRGCTRAGAERTGLRVVAHPEALNPRPVVAHRAGTSVTCSRQETNMVDRSQEVPASNSTPAPLPQRDTGTSSYPGSSLHRTNPATTRAPSGGQR